MHSLKPYLGRLIGAALGLVAAVLFLILGFFKTVLILLCCGAGYAVGVYMDKGRLPEWLFFWKNKW